VAQVAVKMAKCKVCRAEYTKSRPLQSCCSVTCAIEHAKTNREKKDRKDTRTALSRLKTRSEWMKDAQQAFNAYIRERDKDLPCISCQRHHQGQYHAGHYRSTAAAPELRFDYYGNVWKQCSPCNMHKHGNLLEYRIHLLTRIGSDAVAWLEGPHDAKKYTIGELQEIAQGFRQWTRELQKEKPPIKSGLDC